MQQFQCLNTAKLQFGEIRTQVNEAKQEKNISNKVLLLGRIEQTIRELISSRFFFNAIGRACEVDLFIIGYQSLQARLNSS